VPVIEIHSPLLLPPAELLDGLCAAVTHALDLPAGHAWALWQVRPAGTFSRPEWAAGSQAPVVFVRCKSRYTHQQVGTLMRTIQRVLSEALACSADEVYVAVQRVVPHELLVRGAVWEGDVPADGAAQSKGEPATAAGDTIAVRPIGCVSSPRHELTDDDWGDVISTIALDPEQFTADAVAGLESFSHLEVVFFMHRVPQTEVEVGKRHPRGRSDWPAAGIFAQRAKGRPNRIGVSRCRLISVSDLTLTVQALDAVDGTPVIDIKPYLVQFGPIGLVTQPEWASELMAHYYDAADAATDRPPAGAT
jgi:tRNA-Thr(GGU) m(6)t(6)A37 methyltransferase TsaA